MPNENCLAGIRCPKCKQEDKFFIYSQVELEVTDDGTDFPSGDVSWEATSPIRCAECNALGTVADFSLSKIEKRFEVAAYVRKRYTTQTMAVDEEAALKQASDQADALNVEEDEAWSEDYEYYDVEIQNARELKADGQ